MVGLEKPAVISVEAPRQNENWAQRRQRLAAALIGVKREPAGFAALDLIAHEAKSYHALNPYPWWHFRDWKTEERGPYPRCMPFGRTAILRSARWLWGRAVQIQSPNEPAGPLETFMRDAWDRNSMQMRMRAGAELGGQIGGIALKFNYDETAPVPLRFTVLSTVDHCRLYYDPWDREVLLMARIQYPFFDSIVGQWYFCREEWTADEEVHYKPVQAQFVEHISQGVKWPPVATTAVTNEKPDVYEKWEEEYRKPNVFGVIPLQPIRNLDSGGEYGTGDFWGLYRVWDRANLTYHLIDKGNQFDTEPNMVFLDVAAEQHDFDRPLAPGQPISLKSDEGMQGQAKGQVVMLEPSRAGATIQMDYIKDVRRQCLLAAGNIEIGPDEVTNKGNLTSAVLTQLYQPLIELTEEKHESYGENGVCKFLELAAVALRNLTDGPYRGRIKEIAGVRVDDRSTYDVQIGWAPYFQMLQEELTQLVTRQGMEVSQGFTTRERATKAVAAAEGVQDVTALIEEVSAEHDRLEQQDQASLEGALKAAEAPTSMLGNADKSKTTNFTWNDS